MTTSEHLRTRLRDRRHTTRHGRQRPNCDDGSIVVLTAVMLVPLMLALAIVADSGRVWSDRTALQNAVEVTAAKAASTWIRTNTVCPASVTSFLTVDNATPTSSTCTTTGNWREGTITVSATDASPLYFSALLGRSSSTITASTTVKVGGTASLVGVWPIGLCENQPAIVAWKNSGFSLTTQYTITLQSGTNFCTGSAGGNWGLLDFNGGSNPTSEARDWVQNGYQSALDAGSIVGGNPGGISNNIGINTMIGKTVLVPLFNQATGTGNNANYRISGFVKAVLISTNLTGGAGSRSLTVRFETAIVDRASASVGGGSNYGYTTWAICAYDNKGVC